MLNLNRGAIVRGGTNLHPNIPQARRKPSADFMEECEKRGTCAQTQSSRLKQSHGECVWRFYKKLFRVLHARQAERCHHHQRGADDCRRLRTFTAVRKSHLGKG